MIRDDVLECCKQIVLAEKALNATVDNLLEAVGITREEAENGNVHPETDTA